MRIAVLGNSVALSVRPPVATPGQGPFPRLLEVELRAAGLAVEVRSWARWSATIVDGHRLFEEEVLSFGPQQVVLCFGINECCPRMLPRSLWTLLNQTDPTRGSLGRALARWASGALARVTPGVIRTLGLRGWMAPETFGALVDQLIRRVDKELKARVFVLGVTEPSDRVERALPGAKQGAHRFNEMLRVVTSRHSELCTFVDVSGLVAAGHDAFAPDGIHWNLQGHRQVAGLLTDLLRRTVPSKPRSATREDIPS